MQHLHFLEKSCLTSPCPPDIPPRHREGLLRTLLYALLLVATTSAHAEVKFSKDIAPILVRRCIGCHGERAYQGGYRAQTFQNLLRKGASGASPIVAGRPEESRLFQLITSPTAQLRMPKSDDSLSKEQVALVRRWIAEGAKFDKEDRNASFVSLLGARKHPQSPAFYANPLPVLALAFAPSGETFAVGGYNEVLIYETGVGKLVRRIGGLPQRIQSLQYTPNGKMLLVAGGTPGEYGEVVLVDLLAAKRGRVFDTFPDIVLSATLNSDSTKIAVGSADSSVRLYDANSGKSIWASSVHSGWVTSVCFSGDERYVLSASKDMTVKVHDIATGTLFTTYQGHNRQIGTYSGQDAIYAVRPLPHSPDACSGGGGRWLQIWNPVKTQAESGDAGDMEERFAKQGHARYIPHGFAHEVFALIVQDGQIFAGSGDGAIKQFDIESGKEVRAFSAHTDWVYSLSYSSSAHRLVSGSYSGEICLWDTQSGRLLKTLFAQPKAISLKTGR